MRFSVLALAADRRCRLRLPAPKMFRWDAEQRFAERGGKAWVAVALAAWVAVGRARRGPRPHRPRRHRRRVHAAGAAR